MSAPILTPDQRLRVFISSTLQELAEERVAVRRAVETLRLQPVMFEAGARPHPPRDLYRSYLDQSHIFVGIYWQSYGWIGPEMEVSGLEDEFILSLGKPRLLYVKGPAPDRDEKLARMLRTLADEGASCYAHFSSCEELQQLVESDLSHLLSERFQAGRESSPEAAGAGTCTGTSRLPFPPTALLGRGPELEAATRLLVQDGTSLLTLVGPGGVGKSRFAVQLGQELESRFRDGAHLVELQAVRDPDLVVPTVARALGVPDVAGDHGQVDALRQWLASRNLLLLLDNFEQVLPAATHVASLLEACPGLVVVVTSRASLRLRAEHIFEISPLEVPPAGETQGLERISAYPSVQLFTRQVRSVRPAFELTDENAAAVAELCRRLDGLPLAIELAAARVRMFTPAGLLDRLEDRFAVLRGSARDVPERQSTLYHAVDWSYGLLDEDSRCLLRRLAAFSGGWTLETAASVCGPKACGDSVTEGLETLLDGSLIRVADTPDGPRFTMLETIREFAADRLEESGEAGEVRDQHAAAYLLLAKRLVEDPRHREQSDRQLEADLDNLRAAMNRLLETGEIQTALVMATSLWLFWWGQGLWREGVEWMERGLQAEPVDPGVRALALTRAGWLKHQLADNDGATTFLTEATGMWREIGDHAGLSLALSNSGVVVMSTGDYARAIALYEEALRLRRELGDPTTICATSLNLGIAYMDLGDYERSSEIFTEALTLARATEDYQHIGLILLNQGEQHTMQGELDRAEACYAEAEELFTKSRSRAGLVYVAFGRGRAAWMAGDVDGALRLLGETVGRFHDIEDQEYVLHNLDLIAEVADRLGEPRRAAGLLAAADSLRSETGLGRPPQFQPSHDACLLSVCAKLGDAGFASAWKIGAAMDVREATRLAESFCADRYEGRPEETSCAS